MKRCLWTVIAIIAVFITNGLAKVANEWQMNYQPAATPTMEKVNEFHDLLLIVITGIAVAVGILLFATIYRYRESKNTEPSKVTHNTMLEIVWTLVPVLILMVIGVPSVKLLYFADKVEKADMTIKAIGHQWYWTYEYPDEEVEFDSYMVKDADIKPGQYRLLSVDNPVYVPAGATVRVLITSQDVLHSFAVPAFGMKTDAVPGRINETWFRVDKEGTYYGQCSELCGKDHGYMPIAVKVVSQEQYKQWLQKNNAKSTRPKVVEAKAKVAGAVDAAKSSLGTGSDKPNKVGSEQKIEAETSTVVESQGSQGNDKLTQQIEGGN